MQCAYGCVYALVSCWHFCDINKSGMCVRVLHLVSVVVEYVIALLHACINPVNYERYSYTRFTISLTDTLEELNTRTHTR